MDSVFLREKLVRLGDERILKLLTLKHVKNPVFPLAVEEARRRNLDVSGLDLSAMVPVDEPRTTDGLEKWNWAALFLAPLWTLVYRLDRKWTILCWLVPVNIFVVFYLGANGNRLAFEKSDIRNAADFMKVQEIWVRYLIVGISIGLLMEVISHFRAL
ncbi:hypothetical protein KK062_19035 [Fulvivirgaceae bacterium PWU5]|uniref:Uncharacterized protein n=1 Tax=Dawidia cretensis TaxID=2782350 RepID=A0AAP2E070_9BACT|nr:hypothetical protein [Dawidia cretensis]MBT1710350.1 hypothetical protein [Dawidia cretensis]